MKKILLFAGHRYYPQGGAEDFEGSFDSIFYALEYLEAYKPKYSNYVDYWAQMVDVETMEVIETYVNDGSGWGLYEDD